MKTLSYYSAKGTFPTKASFSTVYAYRAGALVFKGTLDEWYAVRSGYPNHAVETVVDTYLKLRASPGETFLTADRRLGETPVQEALDGA